MAMKQSNAAGPSTSAQLNVVQTLHQEQLARLAAVSLPKLASQHSRTFVQMARTHLEGSSNLYEGQKVSTVRYRRALWAESLEPTPAKGKEKADRVVPDFYHLHNPRCRRCALPLIAGVNEASRPSPISPRKRARSRTKKDARICSLCRDSKQHAARQRQLRS